MVLAPPPRLLCCHSVSYVRTVYTRGRLCEAYESPAHVLSSLLCHSSRAPRPLRVQHAPLTAPRTLPQVPMCLNIACARCASGQVRLPVRTRHERRESRFMRNRHSSVFHPQFATPCTPASGAAPPRPRTVLTPWGTQTLRNMRQVHCQVVFVVLRDA